MRFGPVLALLALSTATMACTLGGSGSINAADVNNANSPTPINRLPTNQPTDTPMVLMLAAVAPTSVASATITPTPCSVRKDWPTVTIAVGDTLSSIAARVNSTTNELAAGNCLANANTIVVGRQLHVPNLPPPTATFPPTIASSSCSGTWFFTFNTTPSGSYYDPTVCPQGLITSSAVGEDFEGGRAIWFTIANQPIIYILYNDHTYAMFTDMWSDGQPETDPSIIPPSNRYQPKRGIGKVWREQAGVRDKLGWALEAESVFAGKMQSPESPNCNCEYIYIATGKAGTVVQLIRGTTMGTWNMLNWYIVGYF